LADYKRAPQSQIPDFSDSFARAAAHATPAERLALAHLHKQLDAIVQRAGTSAFKLPLRYGAIFAIAVLPLLGLGLMRSRGRRPPPGPRPPARQTTRGRPRDLVSTDRD